MKQKLLIVFATVILLLSITLSGCSGGSTVTVTNTTTATTTATTGVSQADYDSLKNQLTQAQGDKTTAEAEVASLKAQVAALKAQYEFSSGTLAETATRLVANYKATHIYSSIDYFICGDMASEVWNMLKAQGISSVIVVGNVDNAITDILQSNHAWVIATVDNGAKLALETTAGVTFTKAEKPLYYRGWTFKSPTDLKANNDLIREHNLRVEFYNLLAAETNTAMNLYNNASNEAEADKYMTLYNKLKELMDTQKTKLLQLEGKIANLATVLN